MTPVILDSIVPGLAEKRGSVDEQRWWRMNRAELQDLIDRGGDVVLPSGEHRLDGPLIMRSWARLNGNGATLIASVPGPLIQTDPMTDTVWWSVRNMRLQDGGIHFPTAQGGYPFFFQCENIGVYNAPRAFDDFGSGAFEGELIRVWACECGHGFRRVGGTTLRFDSCFAGSARQTMRGLAWEVVGSNADQLVNCAFDNHESSSAPAVCLRDCDGLTVDGFYAENDRTLGGALMLVQGCDGLRLHGLETLWNSLIAPTGKAAYLLHWHDSRGHLTCTIGGGDRRKPDRAEGEPTGHSVTLIVTGSRTALRLDGTVNPATKIVPEQTAFGLVDQTPRSVVDARGCAVGQNIGPVMT